MGSKRLAWCIASALALLGLSAPLVMGQGVSQGVDDLANKLIQKLPSGKQMTVVVSDFPNLQGGICELGRFLSARLTTRLSQNTSVRVRERTRLNQVLNELAFSMEGLVDPSKAKQVGKLLGADALVLGEVSDLGTTIEVDARLVELETGNTLPGAFTAISKDSVVTDLLKKGCVSSQSVVKQSSIDMPPTGESRHIAKPLDQTGEKPSYENDSYRTIVESVRKTGDIVSVVIVFENLTDKIYRSYLYPAYLIDENGDRWDRQGSDTAGLFSQYTDILGRKKLRTKVEFKAKENNKGNEFTLFAVENLATGGTRPIQIDGLR